MQVATTSSITPQQMAHLRQQAEDMEGVFLNTLTKEMFAGIKSSEDTNFGGGFGEETWRSMQSEQLANTMAEHGGLGIADQLMGELVALQEAANTSKTLFIPGTGVYGK
ncbi:rod-binding protein [Devosia sp. PTR5]|uniref:Rod-binding protein n=1 Tax=Devosia oryzisoli TaxID=2774138 RepID=A0A927IS14_9HYPH|nr:rod-binding protein [Devosia oryzisoli]MBD8064278.1 rod-binding protein [Devosia oryzisoli]